MPKVVCAKCGAGAVYVEEISYVTKGYLRERVIMGKCKVHGKWIVRVSRWKIPKALKATALLVFTAAAPHYEWFPPLKIIPKSYLDEEMRVLSALTMYRRFNYKTSE